MAMRKHLVKKGAWYRPNRRSTTVTTPTLVLLTFVTAFLDVIAPDCSRSIARASHRVRAEHPIVISS
ncbi:hypothetical protein COCSADRAFT_36435 [Bipolaris sorokiniana ND90Pr]|uniref:Uncharacterized protein n=1 Tax=Cochliobolus sativus (strain ND90Pr / ATCC 201652) TaxID=665912 RepID=M2REC7_COCSN|nr:uncharacterized protein COCSADRAFT_36435 [Bipolaris sorokiniana ND90Pr]EMD65094.1 hypothetical protein COCSADRAFT_36435 [Bipolaris sorokiniana ND90Pr]